MADLKPITLAQIYDTSVLLWDGVLRIEQGSLAQHPLEHIAETALTAIRDETAGSAIADVLQERTRLDALLKRPIQHFADRGIYRLLVSKIESVYSGRRLYKQRIPGVYTILLWLYQQDMLLPMLHALRNADIVLDGEAYTVETLTEGAQPTTQTAILWTLTDTIAQFRYNRGTPWAWQEPLFLDLFFQNLQHPQRVHRSAMMVTGIYGQSVRR